MKIKENKMDKEDGNEIKKLKAFIKRKMIRVKTHVKGIKDRFNAMTSVVGPAHPEMEHGLKPCLFSNWLHRMMPCEMVNDTASCRVRSWLTRL